MQELGGSAALAEEARLNSGCTQARGRSCSVICRKSKDKAGGIASGVRAAKSSKLGKGE